MRLTRRFKVLRQNAAFTDFENDEIWEILRISHWRVIHESRPLMVEGEEGGNFGVILDGEVEVSLKGRQLAVYGPGQVIGELAFLSPERARRNTTVIAMVDTTYLEVNAAAYALASEECQFHFKELVVGTLMRRSEEANEKLIENAPNARKSMRDDSEFGFGLVPMGDEFGSADDSQRAPTSVYQTRAGTGRSDGGATSSSRGSSAAAAGAAARAAAAKAPMTDILFGTDGNVRVAGDDR